MTSAQLLAGIRVARRVYGSQAQFARSIGMQPQYLCDVKRGRRPPSKRLRAALAEVKRKARKARAH